MTPLVHVRVQDGNERVAHVSGEVDASNADQLQRQLEAALTESALVLELTELAYVDSAGVRALFEVAEVASIRHVELSIVVPATSPIRRVLAVSGLAEVVAIADHEDVAAE